MNQPLVVVQILLYSEPFDEIDALLTSLTKVDYPKESWRLVIVNNAFAGHDVAAHFERNWKSRVGVDLPETVFHYQNPNLGFAGGHDEAFVISRTFHPDYIYLLNADAHVEPSFLWRVVQMAESQPNAAIVQSRIMLAQEPDKLNSAGNAMHFLGFGYTIGHRQTVAEYVKMPIFSASGAGVLLRVAAIDQMGGLFDADYFLYHEDLDCSWRARLAGFDIVYAEDSVIYHNYQFSKSIKKFYWMERNRHLTNLTNYKWQTLLLIAPAAAIMELGTFAFAIKSGWWKEKLRAWAFFWTPNAWRWIAKNRLKVSKIRRRSDRHLLEFMVGVVVNQEVDNPLLTKVVNPIYNVYFQLLKRIVRW